MAKLGEINSNVFQLALNTLLQNPELTVKASYALLQLNGKVTESVKSFEELRNKLIAKYGKKDDTGKVMVSEDGKEYQIEDRDAFDAEFSELCHLEADLPQIPLSYIEDLKLSPSLLSALLKTVIAP